MKAILVVSILVLNSCGPGVDDIAHVGICEGYAEWETSNYVLPYTPGESISVTQGNCSGVSHGGSSRYSYDFDMEIGTEIRAVRGGEVVGVNESQQDGNGCASGANTLHIEHVDGTVAVYVHLTYNGVVPELGDVVSQGDLVAYSGNTGCTSGAHLHFEVLKGLTKDSVPVTFSNTSANPRGLIPGEEYLAE